MSTSIPSLQIVTDKSGTMRQDIFYCVTSDDYLSWDHLPAAERRGFTVLPPRAPEGTEDEGEVSWLNAHAYAHEWSARSDMMCGDRRAPPHQRQPYVGRLEGDLFGGPAIADFVIDVTLGWFLITDGFAESLRSTTLGGYDLDKFKIVVNQSALSDVTLFHFQAVGRNCERPPCVVHRQNTCPHCKGAPVICETCGCRWFTCPKCRQEMYVTASRHQGAEDPRLVVEPRGRNGGILDGARWDGSDFVASHDHVYFSRRAFEWTSRIHAGPLIGIPARFCVDGMDEEGEERIARITDVSTVEK